MHGEFHDSFELVVTDLDQSLGFNLLSIGPRSSTPVCLPSLATEDVFSVDMMSPITASDVSDVSMVTGTGSDCSDCAPLGWLPDTESELSSIRTLWADMNCEGINLSLEVINTEMDMSLSSLYSVSELEENRDLSLTGGFVFDDGLHVWPLYGHLEVDPAPTFTGEITQDISFDSADSLDTSLPL